MNISPNWSAKKKCAHSYVRRRYRTVSDLRKRTPPMSLMSLIARPTLATKSDDGSSHNKRVCDVFTTDIRNHLGQLKQVHGGSPISGFFSTFVACTGTTPWSMTVQTQATLFHGRSVLLLVGGKANVAGSAFAFDPDTGEFVQRNLSVNIILREGH
jgi:hypothetical protein